MAIYDGYVQGYAGYYKVADGSGPYSISSAGTITLIGAGGGGEGGAGDASAANQLDTNEKLDSLLSVEGSVLDAAATAGGVGTDSAKLRAISGQLVPLQVSIDSVAASTSTTVSQLTTLLAQTDGVEGSLTTTVARLDTLITQTDGLETSSSNIDTNAGAISDAAVAAGATGSESAKLRAISRDIGALTETAPATDTASSGTNGRLQRISQRLTSLIALFPTSLGSATAANSLAVTSSTEDIGRVGIVTETAPVTDIASSGINGRLQRISQRITSLIALFPTALGSVTAANSLATTASTEDVARIGIITETAPASDTASSGLNGRLQRISQRVTSLISLWTATAFSDANRLPVEDRDGLAVTGTVTSAATLFTQDLLGYNAIGLQVTSAGSGCTITYEQSEDQTAWSSAVGMASAALTGGLSSTSTTALGLKFPRLLRYFRARVSTYGSGTVTVVGSLSKSAYQSTSAVGILGGSITAAGAVGHGTGVAGNPVRVAGRARNANYTTLANDNTADLVTTLAGALVGKPYSIPEADWNYAAAAAGINNTTAAVTIAAAAGAGLRNYVTGLQLSSEALGAATEVAIRDGAGGTVLWRTKIGTAGLTAQSIQFASPIKSTANTLLEIVTLTASITGSVYPNVQGYVAP